jgi:hypothetical protein
VNESWSHLGGLTANVNPVEACVMAVGLTLGSASLSLFTQLPESAWTRLADRPIECLEDSTAPSEMPRHLIMESTRSIGLAQFADEGFRLERYNKLAKSDPHNAVKAILYDTSRDLLSKRSAAEWLFSRLVSSRVAGGTPYFEAVLVISSPEQIAEIAVDQYRTSGNERRLAAAASLLRDYGTSAWPALRWIAKSGLADCEYFVDLVATATGIGLSEKIAVLVRMAEVGNVDTKWRILDAIESHPELRHPPILKSLLMGGDEELSEAVSRIM